VNPHGTETCDRFDNNCDALVDSAPGKYDLCSTCFDADRDGVTNCDGDCNDADPRVYRGATEVCDGVDNDCEGSVDLDNQGRRLCVQAPDAGSDAGTDGGEPDAGTGTDGGDDVDAGGGGLSRPGPVTVGCGCGAGTGGGAGTAFLGLLVLALARRRLVRGAAGRGGSPLLGLLLVVITFGALGCQSGLDLPAQPDAGVTDAGNTDVPDAGSKPDSGVILPTDWECGDLAPAPTRALALPGTNFPFAVPQRFEATKVGPGDGVGYVLDDVAGEVAVLVIRRDIPSDVDPADPQASTTIGVREVEALSALAGTPLVGERSERFSRTFARTTFSSSQSMRFGSATSVFALRNRLLAHFSGLSPAELGAVPQPSSAPTELHVLNVMVRLAADNLIIAVAVTPAARLTENQSTLLDFTNGSHLGPEKGVLLPKCETRSIPALKSDFIFVVDNSGSMLEEQQALAEAASSLYAAFEQSGLDFRLGVISTDGDVLRGRGFTTSLTEFQDAVRVGIGGNSVEMGLEYGLRAVQVARIHPDSQRRLREDAGLVLVFFSDEEATNLRSLSDYITAFNTEKAVCYAIVGPRPTGCQRVGLGRANAGLAYLDVAAATGGTSGSICNPNLSEIISEVVLGASGAATRSPLAFQPVSASLSVRVASDLPRARSSGFDYDPAANSVLYFGQAAQQGTSSKVVYYAFVAIN
jgi:MYXO-CTERM domain-containing protein